MVFSSLLFLFWFVPIFFAVYYLCPAKARNIVLFIGSIVFYAWGEPKFLILIFISIFVNYIAGLLMGRFNKKAVLTAALLFDFGMLFVFKYTGFFVENINSLFGCHIKNPQLVLPLGISFYTFQIASYVIDLYRGKIPCCTDFLTLGTYLVMFPQLIAGPIVVYEQVESELKSRRITLSMIEEGIEIFILGLASKVLVANNVGALWEDIGAMGYENISTPLAWLGVVAYTLQIYFDFNGYSLMAIGLGKMLGFNIPQNFNNPYVSRSLTEFWRRWHITLSSWFRDYVYIPLGGNRKGKLRTYINLFIVWFLTGFWHGAGWNFIIWGLFFFVFLSLEKLFIGKFLRRHIVISRIYSLLLIGLSWMIFAITDFGDLTEYFRCLFVPKGCNAALYSSAAALASCADVLYYLRNYGVIIVIGSILSTPLISGWFNRLGAAGHNGAVLLAGENVGGEAVGGEPEAGETVVSEAVSGEIVTGETVGVETEGSETEISETATGETVVGETEISETVGGIKVSDGRTYCHNCRDVLTRALKAVLLLILFIVCVAYLADASYNPFLYFRF